jgi:hypothetical protein
MDGLRPASSCCVPARVIEPPSAQLTRVRLYLQPDPTDGAWISERAIRRKWEGTGARVRRADGALTLSDGRVAGVEVELHRKKAERYGGAPVSTQASRQPPPGQGPGLPGIFYALAGLTSPWPAVGVLGAGVVAVRGAPRAALAHHFADRWDLYRPPRSRPHEHLSLRVVAWLMAGGITAIAFTVSFESIAEHAEGVGSTGRRKYGAPLLVDTFSAAGKVCGAVYAWFVLLAASGVSVALNVAHASDNLVAQAVSALPPVALLAARSWPAPASSGDTRMGCCAKSVRP